MEQIEYLFDNYKKLRLKKINNTIIVPLFLEIKGAKRVMTYQAKKKIWDVLEFDGTMKYVHINLECSPKTYGEYKMQIKSKLVRKAMPGYSGLSGDDKYEHKIHISRKSCPMEMKK